MVQPLKKFSVGSVSATIWENEGREGKNFFSVKLEKSYKDKNDEWKNSNTFSVSDLPKVRLVIDKAYEFVSMKEDGYKKIETT